MTPALTEAQRARLARIADALIPAAPGCLSASQAGIAGPLLDQIIQHVPERMELVRRVVEQADEAAPERVLDLLRREDDAGYDAFCETIAGAYFMSPEVRIQIGYPGRVPVAARSDVADMEELLLPVFEGPFAPRDIPS